MSLILHTLIGYYLNQVNGISEPDLEATNLDILATEASTNEASSLFFFKAPIRSRSPLLTGSRLISLPLATQLFQFAKFEKSKERRLATELGYGFPIGDPWITDGISPWPFASESVLPSQCPGIHPMHSFRSCTHGAVYIGLCHFLSDQIAATSFDVRVKEHPQPSCHAAQAKRHVTPIIGTGHAGQVIGLPWHMELKRFRKKPRIPPYNVYDAPKLLRIANKIRMCQIAALFRRDCSPASNYYLGDFTQPLVAMIDAVMMISTSNDPDPARKRR
ncbi:hypothetical protein R6Q57_019269 [Mikania cordata]